MSFETGTRVAHYVIQRKLGTGGMGEVYLADDTQLGRRVALKFLSSDLVADKQMCERFTREARAAAALQHPNIVTVHEVSSHEGRPFFVMQYAEGTTLTEQLCNVPISYERFYRLSRQLCAGLQEAHRCGVTHRDIKSSNIMIDARDHLLLLDFGLARVSGQEQRTQAGLIMGTVGYMAPELIRGEPADNRTDIFAVGVVLYEMLTGTQPFRRDYPAATLTAVLESDPKPLKDFRPDVPPQLQAVVDTALEKNPGRRYQSVEQLAKALRALDPNEPDSIDLTETVFGGPRPPRRWSKRRILSVVLLGSLLGLLAVALLIIPPKGGGEAQAADRRLAIMGFENLSNAEDPDRLGEIMASLLITDLSASDYVQVVSSQRIYDLFQDLGKESTAPVSRSAATKVAQKAGARWMLLGKILREEPQLTAQIELIETASGRLLASFVERAETGVDVYQLVDRLTVVIKERLNLPVGAFHESDPDIADVTTHSIEAYRHYLDGLRQQSKLYYEDALMSFKRALEYDSTFAMAYLWLAWFHDRKFIDKAVQYSDGASEKERYYILSLHARLNGDFVTSADVLKQMVKKYPDEREAYYWLGNIAYSRLRRPSEAVDYLDKAIAIDPRYKQAYNVMAYACNDLGQFERSIWAINKYIDLAAPDEANPYDSRGELYCWNGKLELGIESLEKALEIRPGFLHSLPKLGAAYIFKGDYDLADSCFVQLATGADRSFRAQGRTLRALIPIYQGEFESALTLLEHGLIADQMDNTYRHWNAQKRHLQSQLLMALGRSTEALTKIDECISIRDGAYPDDAINMRDVVLWQLVQMGEIERAESLMVQIEARMRVATRRDEEAYWRARGCLELARGNAGLAVSYLQQASQTVHSAQFRTRFALGQAYLADGQLGLAVDLLESALSRYDEQRALSPVCAIQAHYFMGLAYEQSGWHREAVQQYRRFLSYWGGSGLPMHEIEDARQRLARLTSLM